MTERGARGALSYFKGVGREMTHCLVMGVWAGGSSVSGARARGGHGSIAGTWGCAARSCGWHAGHVVRRVPDSVARLVCWVQVMDQWSIILGDE
jgi:hypothetical protein